MVHAFKVVVVDARATASEASGPWRLVPAAEESGTRLIIADD
jgi:hypothetical protein